MSTTTQPRRLTVEELRAALHQAWEASAVPADTGPQGAKSPDTTMDAATATTVITVCSVHGGVGASTMALAVAEAIAEVASCRLIDLASPRGSGLLTAVTAELGPDATGWLLGRRGALEIDRLDPGTATTVGPPRVRPGADGLRVVDQGTREPGWLPRHGLRRVVVARATRMGVAAVQPLLQDPASVLVVVGVPRLTRPLTSALGEAGTALEAAGRVVCVRRDTALAARGLTRDRLPRLVQAAGYRVAALLLPDFFDGDATGRPT